MRDVSSGDIIFSSFRDTRITARIARAYCYESPR